MEVDRGKVILKGTVRCSAEKQEAERAAWSAPGGLAVDNRIAISTGGRNERPGAATAAEEESRSGQLAGE